MDPPHTFYERNQQSSASRAQGKDHAHAQLELLAPVGDWAMLRAAIDNGADAVYFGAKQLNMRAMAKNFEVNELPKVVKACHDAGIKAYLTINTIIFDHELAKLDKLVQTAKEAKVDAIICWDPAVIMACKKYDVPFHISTQASIANAKAAEYYASLGAERVVLARECTLEQIRAIHEQLPELELEAFVHGAMCMSISGRCFLSHFMFGKSANRGECLQPCRRSYKVIDEITGKELKVEQHHIFSAKDLAALPFLDALIDAGITVFKIEGRAKAPEYVAYVVRAYRKALDAIREGRFPEMLKKQLMEDLEAVYHREFHAGFYFGMPTNGFTGGRFGEAKKEKQYVGKIVKVYNRVRVAEILVTAHPLKVGNTIMIQGKTTGAREHRITSMRNIHDEEVTVIEKGTIALIKLPFLPKPNEKVFLFEPKQKVQ